MSMQSRSSPYERYRTSLWSKWSTVCSKINTFFDRRFTRLTRFIARHVKVIFTVGTIFPLLLLSGFSRYHLVKRTEDLYIPQNSRAIQDLKRSENYFPMQIKIEEFVIKSKNEKWILTKDIFEVILDIHEKIVTLPGFSEVCVKDKFGVCIANSPLEIFQYNTSKLQNITQTLNHVYTNSSFLLQNGRQASMNYVNFFGYFHFDLSYSNITRAEAVRSFYLVWDPITEKLYERLTKFETHYIELMENMMKKLDEKDVVLLYNSGRSIDISLSDSAKEDIMLVPVALFLMIMFCGVTLARCRNKVLGHFILGVAGIFTLFLGIGSAFGFIMMLGFPYIAFAGVLPFLILGVGIDNMFIIVDAVDRQNPDIKGTQRIVNAVGKVGASITMTTVTDLVAFFVSMVTDFPAIRYFCLYAAFCITFCYLLVITIFIAFLALDVRRIESNQMDIVPCLRDTKMKEEEIWINGRETISNKIMDTYANILMKRPVKYAILLISFLTAVMGVWGAINIDQSFNELVLGLEDSAYVRYFKYFNDAFPTGTQVSVILDDININYTDQRIQQSIIHLDQIAKDNEYTKDDTLNWMTSLYHWAKIRKRNITGPNFLTSLLTFLQENRHFAPDLIFDGSQLKASRILMLSKDNPHSIFRRDAMLSLRKDLKEKSVLPVYAFSFIYIYIEQFVIILQDTIRNLCICACAILIITLPYLVNPIVTFFVFFGFVCMIFELLGLMYIWGVSLNAISMIIIVMAIGFAVDYSAHTAHAFVVSTKKRSEERVIDALTTMGSSISMGGISTFIGVIVTAFSSSELFKIFFKMVFGIVVLGLLHGLVFLPTHLAVFCRTTLKTESPKAQAINNEVGTNANNSNHEDNNEETNEMTVLQKIELN